MQYFYAAGFEAQFSSIHIWAGFIGFDEYNFWINGFLILLSTLTPHVIYFLALPYILRFCSPRERDSCYLLFLALFGSTATCTMVFTHISRRHLMVWRIFAPKLAFDGVFLLVAHLCIILLFFLKGERKDGK